MSWFLLLILPDPEGGVNAIHPHHEYAEQAHCEAARKFSAARFKPEGVVVVCVQAECTHKAYLIGERLNAPYGPVDPPPEARK